jgi:uncharacterized protein
MFDDFLEELRRREAEARGEVPPRRRKGNGNGGDDGDGGDGGDDGDDDRPPHEPSPPRRPRPIVTVDERRGGPRFLWWAIAALVVIVFIGAGVLLDLWTDVLWYQSVGFDAVFWTRIGSQAVLFIGAGALALIVMLGNLWLAGRLMPRPPEGTTGSFRDLFDRLSDATQGSDPRGGGGRWPRDTPPAVSLNADDLPDLTPIATMILIAVSVVIALGIGGSVGAAWETVLLWQHRVPFSPETASVVTDPVFGRDIGFFLFELPFLRFIQGLFNGIVIATLLVVLGRYLVGAMRNGLVFPTTVRVHLAVLGGLFLLSVAFGYQLDKYELVYSQRGLETGVSFTDQNAQFFAFDVLTVLSGLAAALLVGGAFTRMLWPLGLVVGVWFLASIVVGRLYPELVQQLTVNPNQYAQEERYIGNNIAMTRLAFGIDDWEDKAFKGEAFLTRRDIEDEVDTFTNARLWDYRPLGTTLDQLQRVRPYYDFYDVDTDRYIIDDVQRQVMLSARELALDQNPGTATGFVNERIVFTHGIGAAMVPVNEVANEGQPRLFIRNLPPVSVAGAPEIRQPRIYFGERPSDWVVTGARQNEFDYPTGTGEGGDVGTSTRWTGQTGIDLDTTLMRLLFSLRFRDFSLLISDQVTDQSQLLMHRYIGDRLPRIAPFLAFDKDPYLVIDDEGRLVWIQDAYTVSDRFPHGQAFEPADLGGPTGLGNQAFNYLRNSVKITVDAYDGTMHFYIADPSDPLVRAYAGVFPTLFEPIDEMPDGIRAHIRYPEELFNVQTRVLGRYHVTDPLQFFRGDDIWTVPTGQANQQSLPTEAYYVIMRMPGESEAEFLLLQPMIPISRPNMIAWVAARNDGANYGTSRVYRFPVDTTIFGPAQIEARIDQDPIISEQFTLWRNSGSDVIRGNLIVVPVDDALIYLQPIYLQSTGSAFPEFRRIVVASPRQVVWGETLSEALGLLLERDVGPGPSPGESPSPGPEPTPSAGPSGGPSATPAPGPEEPLPTDVAGLIEYAYRHNQQAQAALRAGDFARYGEENAKVDAALERLNELAPDLGLPTPASPTPAP